MGVALTNWTYGRSKVNFIKIEMQNKNAYTNYNL